LTPVETSVVNSELVIKKKKKKQPLGGVTGSMVVNPLYSPPEPGKDPLALSQKREDPIYQPEPSTVSPITQTRKNVKTSLAKSPTELVIENLLRLNAGMSLEKDFLRYRALWPTLAPSHRFMKDTGSLDARLRIKPTPEWWPNVCCT